MQTKPLFKTLPTDFTRRSSANSGAPHPYHPDVVIIGAGISAFTAALEMCEAGKFVTILEREGTAAVGGQCIDAFGGMFFVDTPEQRRIGVHDSQELAWEDWQGYAEFEEDDVLAKWWAQHYIERCVPDVRNWMIKNKIHIFPLANWAERAHDGKGNRVPRFHLTWGCGPALAKGVARKLQQYLGKNLVILAHHRADELILEGGDVLGVRGVKTTDHSPTPTSPAEAISPDTDQPFEVRAAHTIIAAGGWTGNLDRAREQWPTDVWGQPPKDLLCGVWPNMDGHMHDEAVRAGGRINNPTNMWVYAAGISHLQPDYPGHAQALIPMKSAIWAKSNGRRWDPPMLAGTDSRDAVARICNDDHPWSWFILNDAILDREVAVQGALYNKGFRDKNLLYIATQLLIGDKPSAKAVRGCPDVVRAQTIEELAAKMQELQPSVPIDASGMSHDILRYDAELRRGKKFFTDPQMEYLRNVRQFLNDKLRTSAFRPINGACGNGELVAIRVRPTVRKSLGGILTDQHCRVINDLQEPITGLYAIGESTGFGGGGMNGARTLEGTLLGGCILTARTVGQYINNC